MNSFNVYGQTEKKVGGNTPVWLGTVKPIPRGNSISSIPGEFIPAGSACIYNAEDRTATPITNLNTGMLPSANCFLYNDVYEEEGVINPGNGFKASCALVMHHPEGLLIERVYPDITEEQIAQLQSQIPGVLLVRG
jgi:hypothetical protein